MTVVTSSASVVANPLPKIVIELLWSPDNSAANFVDLGTQAGDVVMDHIEQLSPKDYRQRSLQAQAGSLGIQLGQTRLLLLEQRLVPVPKALHGYSNLLAFCVIRQLLAVCTFQRHYDWQFGRLCCIGFRRDLPDY